jgi:Cu(I)/Ag(I) efflux system membrane fusion protein
MIGVTYATVKMENISRTIETTGRIAFDPDLYTAIEEYRQALSSQEALATSSFGNIKNQSSALVESSKTRLKLLGISDGQIHKLGRSTRDPINLILPKGKAWVYAEVFEYEASSLRQGLSIEAKSPSAPGKIFNGKISSISQVISQPTRTVRIQAEVDDPGNALRADSYLNVVIHIDLGENLAIPEESVMFSQNRAYVFVASAKGRFEPRSIELGEKANSKYVVISGLSVGEEIVKSANFLIDSEAKLRSVIEKASRGGDAP